MKQREMWKEKARELAIASPGQASEEQKFAWGEYKNYRNKINNKKVFEETNYKKEKITEDIQYIAKIWNSTDAFMGWKNTGSPSQIVVNN